MRWPRRRGSTEPSQGGRRPLPPPELKASTSSVLNPLEMIDHVQQGFKTLAANKVRTGLSMLGILIGVAAVIAMLALGRGAQKAIEKKITQVVFDRNGYLYHGVVKAMADGAREGGLKF